MRCLILIALSLALANASWYNKNRFYRLLRNYGMDEMSPIYGNEYGRWGDMSSCEMNPWSPECVSGEHFDEEDLEYGPKMWGRSRNWEQGPWSSQWQGIPTREIENELYEREPFVPYSSMEDWTETTPYNPLGIPSLVGGQCIPKFHLLPKLENINCHLATALYKQARRERDDKNIVVSPTAVLLGLGALHVGAKGHTKREIGLVAGEKPVLNGLTALVHLLKKGTPESLISQGMTFPDVESMITPGFENIWTPEQMIGESCIGGKCSVIKPVTGIFLSKTTPAQQYFKQIVQGCLGTKVQKCDFERQPKMCRKMINRWVSMKTNNKMPALVPKDGITDNTKMVVVSALNLKAQWGPQFLNHKTVVAPFFPLDSVKTKIVPMMKKFGVFKYHESDLVKVLGIPTQGNELTMYVILPKCKKCLVDVEKEQLLEGDQLRRLLDNCDQRVHKVDVRLPKFQIKHKIDAKRTLLNKGMINMFEQNTADFSGITGCHECSQKATMNLRRPFGTPYPIEESDWMLKQGQVHLNKFLHQATIKITDSGITAATPDQFNVMDEDMPYGPFNTMRDVFPIEDEMEPSFFDSTYRTSRDVFDEITGIRSYGHGPWGMTPVKIFNADHPFAFVVRHNPTKQMLLVGRVIDAAQKHIPTSTFEYPLEEMTYGADMSEMF